MVSVQWRSHRPGLCATLISAVLIGAPAAVPGGLALAYAEVTPPSDVLSAASQMDAPEFEERSAGVSSSGGSVQVGVGTTTYLGKGTPERHRNYSAMELQGSHYLQTPYLEVKVEAQGLFSLNHLDYHFAEIPELYVGTSPQQGDLQLTVGRRIENWSQLDETWGLGIWQPRFRWDYIDPQSVGLVGAYLTYQRPNLRVVMMGSPLYVPDRGAPLDFQEGRIQSRSPWLVNLPYSAELFEQSTPVRYTAEIPAIAEIVSQQVVSGLVRAGGEKGEWASVAYAYKPMNQLLISYEAYHMNAISEVAATIYPRVEYHHLASVQGGFSGERSEMSLSLLMDAPESTMQHPRLTSQKLRNSVAVSPSVSYNLRGAGTDASTVDISYLRQWGGDAPDSGRLATGVSSFESRYPFKNALRAGVRSSLSPIFGQGGRPFYGSLRSILDFDNPGNIFSPQLAYKPTRSWSMMVGADLITSFSDAPENPNSPDFISRYRANDRVYGGVSYAF